MKPSLKTALYLLNFFQNQLLGHHELFSRVSNRWRQNECGLCCWVLPVVHIEPSFSCTQNVLRHLLLWKWADSETAPEPEVRPAIPSAASSSPRQMTWSWGFQGPFWKVMSGQTWKYGPSHRISAGKTGRVRRVSERRSPRKNPPKNSLPALKVKTTTKEMLMDSRRKRLSQALSRSMFEVWGEGALGW